MTEAVAFLPVQIFEKAWNPHCATQYGSWWFLGDGISGLVKTFPPKNVKTTRATPPLLFKRHLQACPSNVGHRRARAVTDVRVMRVRLTPGSPLGCCERRSGQGMRAGPHHCLLVMSQEKEPLFRLCYCISDQRLLAMQRLSITSACFVLAVSGCTPTYGSHRTRCIPPPPRQCWAQKPLYSWRDVIRAPLLVVGLQDLHLHCYGVWPGPLAQGPRVSELGIHFSPPAEAGLAKLNGSP